MFKNINTKIYVNIIDNLLYTELTHQIMYNIRKIESSDYNKGYVQLLQKFASFETPIKQSEFTNFISTNAKASAQTNAQTNITHILVIEDTNTKQIVGAGTIFILPKLHNNVNNMGFIQDVVIEEQLRGKGLGKQLVNKLLELGKQLKCYKVILNCNPNNEGFYSKLGFNKKGFEFDYRL